ncbi:hypothetical protein [Ligilactobacillus equi]|uniref:hypothetical protein n=1 Tax=Ligilactobacillus equi TaxID=137357 RepID=UPI000468C401|nr:hypothetical protein [Ligilactobacillus equi]
MVTKSQIKASRKWEEKNPDRNGFMKLKRSAFSFVDPKPGSVAERQINENREDYQRFLKELKVSLENKLREF